MALSVFTKNVNLTISAPLGAVNHSNPEILCLPPKWYEYLLFFATNYLAHAFTVITLPGQEWYETLSVGALALVLPFSGIPRARGAVIDRAICYRDPVRKAARAGALCMVGRISAQGKERRKAQDGRATTTDKIAQPGAPQGEELEWHADTDSVYTDRIDGSLIVVSGEYRLSGDIHDSNAANG